MTVSCSPEHGSPQDGESAGRERGDRLGSLRCTWFGHAAVEVETSGGKRILFDPWLGNPRSPVDRSAVAAPDILLVTHGHYDHLGGEPGKLEDSDAIAIARRTSPAWPCSHEMEMWLGRVLTDGAAEIMGMNIGGTVEARGLRVSMVRADHSSGDAEGGHSLYLGSAAGFVVETEDGRRIYHAGDTDVFGDMALIRELHAPEVAFLPIGGHYTMGPRGAAMACGLLGVRTVVPLHYGTFPVLAGTPEELRRELAERGLGGVEVLTPELGECMTIH